MTIFRNILIIVFAGALSAFFVYGSFVFGTISTDVPVVPGTHQIKKTIASIAIDSKWSQSVIYAPYQNRSTGSGFLSLELGRLATAFVMDTPSPNISFSGSHDMVFENLQGIISLYDPFTSYTLHPVDHSYQVNQITSGSFYISDEPDGTISIYSIDVVLELSFFDQGSKMTSMILFPGMYIRFDPASNRELRWADLFRIMLVLGDEKNEKITGLEFINPRVDSGKGEDIFFVYRLPTHTRPLFQMLHLLFRDRIKQVDLIKNYASNRSLATLEDTNTLIHNPSKKNYYLLDDLRSVLSRAVQSRMDPIDFRAKIEQIDTDSEKLIKGNSVQMTLEAFLTDARFAIFGNVANSQFDTIYAETASILGITPDTGKGKFFQYLSDIYSRNIISQRRDPTFSGIDTYTPTADGLQRTLNNENIESKDYFDIALYAYQLLQKAQDKQMLTPESLSSRATYGLIETLFGATEKYIQWLTSVELQKSAYQTLVIQFYAPIANTISRSIYGSYTTYANNKIYLAKQYLDGDRIQFDAKIKENIETTYTLLKTTYENIAPLYGTGEQQYALIALRDSIVRIGGFIDMTQEWRYREYQKSPYTGIDLGGIAVPNITPDGKIELYQAVASIVPTEAIAPVAIDTIVAPDLNTDVMIPVAQ